MLVICALQTNHVSDDTYDMTQNLFAYYYYGNFLFYITYCINIL